MSGIVLPSKKKGYVEIMFDDHKIQHSSDADVKEKKTIGPAGNFKWIPTKIVALRQIKVKPVVHPIVGGPGFSHKFKIGDNCTHRRLKITWSAESPSTIDEISYMVIGEV